MTKMTPAQKKALAAAVQASKTPVATPEELAKMSPYDLDRATNQDGVVKTRTVMIGRRVAQVLLSKGLITVTYSHRDYAMAKATEKGVRSLS